MEVIKRLTILLVFIIVIASCKQDANTEFLNIVKIMDNYDYKKAVELFNEFDEKYPDYYYSNKQEENNVVYNFEEKQMNTSIMRLKCYEAIGDFDSAEKEMNILLKKPYFSTSSVIAGISLYEMFTSRLLVKYFKYDESIKYIKKVYSIYEKYEKENNSESLNKFWSTVKNANIDNLMVSVIMYQKEKFEIEYLNGVDEDIEDGLKIILNSFDKLELLRTLAILIDYKTIDGKYYSDLIWTRPVTKKYFGELVKKKLIDKNTLVKLKKMIYRQEIPKDFEALFNEYVK